MTPRQKGHYRSVLHKEGGASPDLRLREEERESLTLSFYRGSCLERGREGAEFEPLDSHQFFGIVVPP